MGSKFRNRGRIVRTAIAGAIVAGSLAAASVANAATDPPRPPGPPAPPKPVGVIQICNVTLSGSISGALEYQVRGGIPSRVSVAAGKCSDQVPVIVNEVAVTQLPQRGVSVRSITARPPERLIWAYLEAGQGIVRAPSLREPTIVTFGNVAGR